jgi:hypothetical protein
MANTIGVPDTLLNQMLPFIAIPDSDGMAWQWDVSGDTISYGATDYIYGLYDFNTPADSGSWCNSDNPYYFSAYPQTTLVLQADGTFNPYNMDVFLLFNNLSSMVHVYYTVGNSFGYGYAPLGIQCTIVAVGVKDGHLYSTFQPITIGSNQTYNFSLTQTTTADFKTQLEALN